MAKRKRVTPSVDEVGVPKGPQARRIPRYNIVGDAGTPIGPNPLEQLSNALNNFNQGFQTAAVGKVKADERRAAEMMPELAKHVTDTAVKLKKGFDELNINQVYNPAVISAGYTYTGDRFGQEDVFQIVRSPEFHQYANQELNKEGDYEQKLTDRILSSLPNRDMDDITKSQYWKRGYDPAVQDASDKVLPVFLKNWENNQLAKSRESHYLKAQDTLTAYLDGEVGLDSFTNLMAEQRNTLIVPAGKFSATIIKDAVTPVLLGKISDPETDLDELTDKVEALFKARRKTDKGSTVLFGSQQQGLENMFARLYDAEMAQGSKSRRLQQADEQEFAATADDIAKSWPAVKERYGPALADMGVTKFTDLTVETLPKLAKLLLTPDDETGQTFIDKFDLKKWNRMARTQQGAFVEEMRMAFVDFSNKKSEGLDLNDLSIDSFASRAIDKNPEFTEAINGMKPLLGKYLLQPGPFSSNYYQDFYKKIDTECAAQEMGIEEQVLVRVLNNKLKKQIDAGGPAVAQMLLNAAQEQKKLGVVPKGYADQLRNIIEKNFEGDSEVDGQLEEVATFLEGEEKIGDYVGDIKFADVLKTLANQARNENPNSPLIEVEKYFDMTVTQAERAGDKDHVDPDAYKGNRAAASAVVDRLKLDFNQVRAAETRLAEGKTPDMGEYWKTTGLVETSAQVVERLMEMRGTYEEEYNAQTIDLEVTDALNKVGVIGGKYNQEQARFVEGMYETNIDELTDQFNLQLKHHEKGMETLINLEPIEEGRDSFPYEFFAQKEGFLGDTRYSKLHGIAGEADKFLTDMRADIGEIRGQGTALSEQALHKNVSEQLKQNKANEAEALNQYKQGMLRYKGVSWQDLMKGEANYDFDHNGITIEVPITFEDVNFKSSIFFKDWNEVNTLEGLFDRQEALDLGTWEVDKDSVKPPELSDDETKQLKLYTNFVQQVTDINLNETLPHNRKIAHTKYREWSAAQRLQMIATDPTKMPAELNFKIKSKAIDNFTESGHTVTAWHGGTAQHLYRWKGKEYTRNEVDAVRAVKAYNDFVATGNFSLKTGITGKEFMKMYGLIARGQVYPRRHYRSGTRGGDWVKYRTRGVGNFHPSTPMTEFNLPRGVRGLPTADATSAENVIAEELFLSELGKKNVTSSYLRGPVLSLTPTHYNAGVARWKKLLKSTDRTKELSNAFKRLYEYTDFDKVYGQKDESNSIRSLLAPFDMQIQPLPDK